MEEDLNALTADCIVVCCCCQCLALQVIVFVLLKVPYKVCRKTRKYAKRRLQGGKRRDKKMVRSERGEYQDDHWSVECNRGSMRVDKGFPLDGVNEFGCIEEVETVLEELCKKGEFAFGSFWGREGSGVSSTRHEMDFCPLHCDIIQVNFCPIPLSGLDH